MSDARITNLRRLLIPYELDGPGFDLISWLPITYDEATETGTYFFKMLPGAETAAHTHRGYEEYYVIEGGAVESDGRVLGRGAHGQPSAGIHAQHSHRPGLPADRDRVAAPWPTRLALVDRIDHVLTHALAEPFGRRRVA